MDDHSSAPRDNSSSAPTASAGVVIALLLWAFIAGTTLPLATANNAILNTRSSTPHAQSFYTAALGVALGGLLALPSASLAPAKWQLPTWWALIGGLCSLPAFGMLIAAPTLGVQVTLLVLLSVQLVFTLILDHTAGINFCSNYFRPFGVFLVVLGSGIDQQACQHESKGVDPTPSGLLDLGPNVSLMHGKTSLTQYNTVLCILLAAATGVGYALQAKFNDRLGKDLGSASRATMVSAAVATAASLPIMFVLCEFYNRRPVFRLYDWPRFIFAAFQSGFYYFSLSFIPGAIGFTPFFIAVHAGSLVVSSILDAYGSLGTIIAFTWARGAAILIIFAGMVCYCWGDIRSDSPSQLQVENGKIGNASKSYGAGESSLTHLESGA